MGPDPRTIVNPVWQDEVVEDTGNGCSRSLVQRLGPAISTAVVAQQGKLALWAPVALGSGVACYFALSGEPGWILTGAIGLFALMLLVLSTRSSRPGVLVLVALLAAGLCLPKVRTYIVAASALGATSGQVELSGWIKRIVNATGNNPRVLIEVDEIKGLKRGAWPSLVQVTVLKPGTVPVPGDYVRLSARLFPLPGPLAPGAYDHGRTLWFKGIGATGRGKVLKVQEGEAAATKAQRFDWRRPIDQLRAAINARLQAAMPKTSAGLAVALITGDRSLITRKQREQMAIAGLAHVLAISGLHMSLVAGGTFWLVRALLAFFPALVLYWPIKKWAAVAAISVGSVYLLISGAAISTQRAYVMLLIMLIAIIADRPAITLRNLAIAALIIILISPEAVTTASFQMSFMAVMGLISAYEAVRNWRGRRIKIRPSGWKPPGVARWFMFAIAGLMFTTLIAGLFTGLPAAYHFHRIAPYSLIANLLALPVISLVIMPAAATGTFLMPLGLEAFPLWLMDQGLRYVVSVSQFVVSLSHSTIPVAKMQGPFVLVAAYGAIWLCLAVGRVRLLGVVAVAVGLFLPAAAERPDLLVERTAKNVALRNADGQLAFAHSRRGRFAGERWLRADGDGAKLGEAAKRTGWTCAGKQCVAELSGKKVVYYMDEAKVAADCAAADILVTQFPLRRQCRNVPVRIDRFDVWRNGAHAIYLNEVGLRLVTAQEHRGSRPWVVKPVARKSIRSEPIADTGKATSTGSKKAAAQ